jgi:phosphoglycolate phosphatase
MFFSKRHISIMPKKLILFDFDGTIVHSQSSILAIINRLSNEFGYHTLSEETFYSLRNEKSQDILKKLSIPLLKLPFFVRKFRRELNKEIEFMKPISNIRDILFILKNKGYILGILTSNSKENVTSFIDKNDLDFFSLIFSERNLFGKSNVLRAILKNQNLKPEEVIYVGDETRDIEAAQSNNIQIIAVCWGFNSKKILQKQNPDFLIEEPKELAEII